MNDIEVVVNPHWMYENEPYHLARWRKGNKVFLAAYDQGRITLRDTAGLREQRGEGKRYSVPTEFDLPN